MTEVYSACVVGGGAGGRLSLDALTASERFRAVAVADLRPEVCRELAGMYPGLRTFASHHEMFAACPTEVVCVSTYAPSHLSITEDALAQPIRGILVEKPLGESAAAGHAVIKAVRERGIPMAVPHGLLVAAHAAEVLRLLRDRAIGDLHLVEIECSGWDLMNAGIHWINFFVAAVGNEPIASVQCSCDTATRTYRDGFQVETESVCMIVTRSGVRCIVHMGDEIPVVGDSRTRFRFVGSRGILSFGGWQPGYTLLNADHPAGREFRPEGNGRSPHRLHLERLAENMDAGSPDYAVADSSLLALEAIEAAYISARNGCKVTLPLSEFCRPAPSDWVAGQPYKGVGGGRDGRQFG